MGRTEADQREYLLAACDCLEAGGLLSFRALRTQWHRGEPIADFRTKLLTPSEDGEEIPETMVWESPSQPLSAEVTGERGVAWQKLEAIWATIQTVEEASATAELSQLTMCPWPDLKELAIRSRAVFSARELIRKEWPQQSRFDLMQMFFNVLMKPMRQTVQERQTLRGEFGIDFGVDVRLTTYCQQLKQAAPEFYEVVREPIESVVQVHPRAPRLVNGRRPLSTGMKWALGAMIMAPIARFAIQLLSIEPPPPPRVDPQLLAQRQAENARIIQKAMQTPLPPPPPLKISFLPPKLPPELETEFQAFCQLCDRQNSTSDYRDALVAMQALREMRRKEPARFDQFAFERMRRFAPTEPPANQTASRPIPATAEELRQFHVLTIWTERDRKAGREDSPGEKQLLEYMRSLGPRLTTVTTEYRARLAENPKAFPALQTLEREFEIPRLSVPPTKSETPR